MRHLECTKVPKMIEFWRVFESFKLMVKKCYQTGELKQDKNWLKMPKLKNSNETFRVYKSAEND